MEPESSKRETEGMKMQPDGVKIELEDRKMEPERSNANSWSRAAGALTSLCPGSTSSSSVPVRVAGRLWRATA